MREHCRAVAEAGPRSNVTGAGYQAGEATDMSTEEEMTGFRSISLSGKKGRQGILIIAFDHPKF